MKQLFRTRTLKHEDYADSGLKRCLSAFDLTLLGIGAIIGTGIFVLTGIAAANQAGPAVVLSFIIAGVACAFAALAYAELAASLGGCGSAYGYSYSAFGEFIAWMIGWTLLLEYGMSVAAVANGWAGYFGNALASMGLHLPKAITTHPQNGGVGEPPAGARVPVPADGRDGGEQHGARAAHLARRPAPRRRFAGRIGEGADRGRARQGGVNGGRRGDHPPPRLQFPSGRRMLPDLRVHPRSRDQRRQL